MADLSKQWDTEDEDMEKTETPAVTAPKPTPTDIAPEPTPETGAPEEPAPPNKQIQDGPKLNCRFCDQKFFFQRVLDNHSIMTHGGKKVHQIFLKINSIL